MIFFFVLEFYILIHFFIFKRKQTLFEKTNRQTILVWPKIVNPGRNTIRRRAYSQRRYAAAKTTERVLPFAIFLAKARQRAQKYQ